MSYTLVQSNTGSGAVGVGLTATVTLPSPTAAGNKVVIVAFSQSTTGIHAVTGFVLDVNPKLTINTTSAIEFFTKTSSSGETSWTITGFGNAADVVIWKVFEIAGLGAVDKTATSGGGGTPALTAVTGTTATTTSATELAIAAVVGEQTTTPTFSSWSGGFTQQGSVASNAISGGFGTLGVAFLELVATGTPSSTVTFGATAYGFGCVATYVESGGGPPPATGSFLPFF